MTLDDGPVLTGPPPSDPLIPPAWIASAQRLAMLQRLTAALGGATDSVAVARVVTAAAGETFGARIGFVARIAGDRCQVLASTGLPERVPGSWLDFPARVNDAIAETLRQPSGRVTWWMSRAERDRRYPSLARINDGCEAGALAPVVIGGQPAGLVGFGWTRSRGFTSADQDLLVAVACQTSIALERAQLFDAEHRALALARLAQRRFSLLAEVSAQLAETGDAKEQLTRLADLLITSGFGDWCAVFVPDETGTLYRRVLRAADPALRPLTEALVDTPVIAAGEEDCRIVPWRTGRSVFTADADLPSYVRECGEDLVTLASPMPERGSSWTVPLIARGRTLGAFALWRMHRSDPFEPDDRLFLEDLGRRAGTAIDNLRLLAERTRVAARLQENLLPDKLPTIPGVELAVGYLVADDAADVGGDFYDAFPVDDGYALVIGDVSGRGIDAAGLTGLARATIRALASHLPPHTMLARLNTLLAERTTNERFLTLAYLLLRPNQAGATLRIWLAGHFPPLLIRPDGTTAELGIPGHLLGAFPTVTHHERTCDLAPGDLLVLCTDGLFEARGPEGMFGTSRLPALLPSLAGRTAADAVHLLEQSITDYRAGTSADDTALLAVRLPPPTEAPERVLLEQRLAAEPSAAAQALRLVEAALVPRVGQEQTRPILAAIEEMLAEALRRHTAQPSRSPRPDPLCLRLTGRGDALRVEVCHPAARPSLPPASGAPVTTGQRRERELKLIQTVAGTHGTTTSNGMTCVWFQTPRAAAPAPNG
ncbi:MAG: SpoIIE family protein phosphatase [Micromonosporaceae bacterium]|nr:SpoIIE family protein phosphatase [Micromonosporaceae bacterium]